MKSYTNIVGFSTLKPTRWRFYSFILMCIMCITMLVVLIGVNMIQKKVSGSILSNIKGLIGYGVNNPTAQRSAIALLSYMKKNQPLPEQVVLDIYSHWYKNNCQTVSSGSMIGCTLYNDRHELLRYLGYESPKTYLILLQNSAEIRPNGGFYGSFIRLTLVSGMVQTMNIHDSYEVPFTNSGISLSLPEWTKYYLGHSNATFIAGNKFGFTDRDGFVISSIYKKTYNTNIDGVLFISTNTLTKLIPSLQYELWKWQFINASVDLIRGKNTSFKKQLYLDELKGYINKSKIIFVSQVFEHYENLTDVGMIQVYLPEKSPSLHRTLVKLNWITQYEPDHIYWWNINQSYNKIDNFVTRAYELKNENGDILYSSQEPILNLGSLASGQYILHLSYDVKIPSNYKNYISRLEQEYNIILTEKQYHILGLNQLFAYRSVLFTSTGVVFNAITGDVSQIQIFTAPPGQGASYYVSSTGESKDVYIFLTKK